MGQLSNYRMAKFRIIDIDIDIIRYIIVFSVCFVLTHMDAYGMVFLDSLRNPFPYFGWPLLTYPNSNGP